MITSTTLRVLNMSSNRLSGELPLLIGDCSVLDLSNNQFEGNLTKMVKWGNIEFLDLSQNRLIGPIPETASQFLHLNHLNLSHNSLSGSLPKFVTQFPKLSILDLSFNQVGGPLQTNLLMMPTLQELHLAYNSFVGDIELSPPPSRESNLRILDLSHNHLDGYFPDQFGSLAGLEVLDLAGNNLTGSLPTSMNDMTSLTSLDVSENHFTGSLPNNLSSNLQSFNASHNDLSGVVPENLSKFPRSSFYPGNSKLQFPNAPSGPESSASGSSHRRSMKTLIKVIIVVACVVAFFILILLAIFVHYIRISRRPLLDDVTKRDVQRKVASSRSGLGGRGSPQNLVISAEDIITTRKGPASEIISSEEKAAVVSRFSPSKNSQLSWSPGSGESFGAENLAKLDVRSPDQLAGELYFLDDTMSLTPEELSRAPAEVLGRSSHGTSYRATLDNGLFLTVKWLREGVARPKKDFAKEARKFANIRHPNVVTLRGYYWGPTQHEKLLLSDYISPGSLAGFLYGNNLLFLI